MGNRVRRSFAIASMVAAVASPLAMTVHAQEPTILVQENPTQAAKHQAEIAFLKINGPGEGEGQEARQKVILDLGTVQSDVVKDKPYATETSTETVQTLADGNRIVNRTVSKFYRDSQGRTRREQTFGNVDPTNPGPHEVKVFIDDPVNESAYVLDPGEKSARAIVHSIKFLDESNSSAPPRRLMKITVDHASDDSGISHPASLPKLDEQHDIVREDLGKKVIEGVECTGKQQTITIPIGAVGNERPISVVTETWTSLAIGAVVQSTTSDPRFGQTTYQLHNVQLGEQQRQLFEPPADYRIERTK
jgi:hypothetical protein